MKKITDAQVAKELGWRMVSRAPNYDHPRQWLCWKRGDGSIKNGAGSLTLPPFTKSLDAVVKEVERLGLDLSVVKMEEEGQPVYCANIFKICDSGNGMGIDKNLAYAMASALMAYLKESRP